jgi:hypothetical protein
MAGVIETPALRGLLRFGTGAGIVAGERDLEVCLARVRPGGARQLGVLRIENYRERPASEWGREYAEFLARHEGSHLAAWLVLPRHEVVVRHVRLPGVTDKDAPAAIAFQLDSLHPFASEEATHDFRRVGRSGSFCVAVAERRTIGFFTALFAEAGVKLAGMTFSGSAVFVSARLYGPPPAGFVAVRRVEDTGEPAVEVYGESPAYPLFSAVFDTEAERAAALAAAEMRLEPGAPVLAWEEVLPKPADGGEGERAPAAAWAAALAAACPHLGTPVNLLPEAMRAASSRAQYVPAAVLAGSLVLLGAAMIADSAWMDRQYRKTLEAEMARLAPQAQRVEKLDRELAMAVERIQLLESCRRRTRGHLDTVLELNEMIEPPGWLMSLQVAPDQATLWGESPRADELLKKLDSSPRFHSAEFTAPLSRGPAGDVFRIRVKREDGR